VITTTAQPDQKPEIRIININEINRNDHKQAHVNFHNYL
jgi:hypothetical protein